jgi:hypothetical protein
MKASRSPCRDSRHPDRFRVSLVLEERLEIVCLDIPDERVALRRIVANHELATQGVAGGVASGEVSDGTGVGGTEGVEVPETVVLGLSLGVGVADVLLGKGVAVLLCVGRDWLLSVGDGAGFGFETVAPGGGRTSR